MDLVSYVVGLQAGKTPTQEKTVDITENGIASVTPDAGFALSKVTVNANVESGIKLNIAYGDTAPEDTSKLWVKTTEPSKVLVTTEMEKPNAEFSFVDENFTVTNVRVNAGYALYDNKVFAFGGHKSTGSNTTMLNTISCYDLSAKIETTITTTLGVAMKPAGIAKFGKYIYIVGGAKGTGTYDYVKTIYKFDADEQEITTTDKTIALRSCYFNRFFHPDSSVCYILETKSYTDATGSLYKFDAETEDITLISSEYPALYLLATTYDGERYLYYKKDSAIYKIDSLDEFSQTAVATTNGTTKGDEIYYVANTILCSAGTMQVGSGIWGINTIIQFVDLKTGTVTEIPDETKTELYGATTAFWGNCGVPVGKKLYIFPGYKDSNASYTARLQSVYSFTPPITDVAVEADSLLIVPKIGANVFDIINSDSVRFEIGIDTVLKGNAEGVGESVDTALYKNGAWETI